MESATQRSRCQIPISRSLLTMWSHCPACLHWAGQGTRLKVCNHESGLILFLLPLWRPFFRSIWWSRNYPNTQSTSLRVTIHSSAHVPYTNMYLLAIFKMSNFKLLAIVFPIMSLRCLETHTAYPTMCDACSIMLWNVSFSASQWCSDLQISYWTCKVSTSWKIFMNTQIA